MHIRRCSAADLHVDAERLVPSLHKLASVHRSTEQLGGASSWAINSLHCHTVSFSAHASPPNTHILKQKEELLCKKSETCYLEKDRQENEPSWKPVFIQLITAVYFRMISGFPNRSEQPRTKARFGICYCICSENISIFLYIYKYI